MWLRKADARHRPGATGILTRVIVVSLIALGFAAAMRHVPSEAFRSAPRAADTLVASIRAEPRSFNRYVARDLTTTVITYLTQSALVRVNRMTNQLEPELAERWELLADHRTYRISLVPGVRFSDGTPFSAEDVAFSFQAIYDPLTASVLADTLRVRDQPLTISVENATTVAIRFPSPFGSGLRLLDGVPILPRHRLEPRLKAGTFRSAWGPSTPPSELAGLGPFMLRRYEPGQRLTFDRNPYYWRREGGHALPRLDHVVLDVVPDQDAESLKLQSGEIDLTQSEMRASDVALLRRVADRGRVGFTDLGVGLDGDLFWFNLTAAKAADARSRWLQHPDFRRVVSQSIDRQAFVNTVYLGAAVPGYGVVSPGNRDWYENAPAPGYDVAAAKRLLASLKLTDRNQDGTLQDADGAPVHFTLLTQKGNTSLERGASVIRESLAQVGVHVDVVALEVGALIEYVTSG